MTNSVPLAPAEAYPAQLTGHLSAPLSRWLWLVKWILVIPHVIVLFFLSIAALVTTVISGFAILFTGRYPRSLFEFSVGVVRWGWRVCFYSYSALGTDQYPPFTLAKTDYPADFDIAYPERLNRGLVLVKWWLLAIPHYIIVAIIAGGGWGWSNWRDSDGKWDTANDWKNVDSWNYEAGWSDGGVSLLGILVLIAAIILLFSARYPRPLFNFVMGLNRWAFRVQAYALLLTDKYPPFRLDQGPTEPTPAELTAVEPPK